MAQLNLHFLGELEVIRDGASLDLPPSKKTRGLLAYLALNNKPFRREQLCELLWEVPDDPRGSLRWSLSKLRRLVDEEAHPRIVADRTRVAFDADDVDIDVATLHKLIKAGPEKQSTAQLLEAAARYRGNFLEGLELPNFPEFYTWSVAEREHANRSQATILRELIQRLREQPEAALEHTRMLVTIQPYDESARATLIRLLVTLGRSQEAEQQYRLGKRLLEEVGAEDKGILLKAWRHGDGITINADKAFAEKARVSESRKPKSPLVSQIITTEAPLFGRDNEIQNLTQFLVQHARQRRAGFMLIRGEPGIGKSRLLDAVVPLAREFGAGLLRAEAFESEVIRPYALWQDAFRRSSAVETPELLNSTDRIDRDTLFGGLSDLVARETEQNPVVAILDDIQWCDESSAAALHYVLRMNRRRPLLVVAAAREIELRENHAMQQTLRGLRREHLLQELRIGPLASSALRELIAAFAPGADSPRLSRECGGNPLLAIELARAETERDSGASLNELIQERMSRLDIDATEVLHWAAVLAPRIDVSSLARVTGLDDSQLQDALEIVERQGVLKSSDRGFRFSHDLVAQSVYMDISPARRQVMHRRVAEFLEVDTALDLQLAADLAHHAAQSGDPALAARAMVFAGRLCLRFYANEEALNLVDKGLQFAEKLSDAERICLTLDLSEIRLTAAPPHNWENAAAEYVALAERALDHGALPYARLGYQLASYVRWVHGQWSDAQRDSLQAERVTRAGSEEDHILGMAETAKCLALLERDLSQADAMLLEAHSLASRKQVHCTPIPAAQGILRYYENNLDAAEELLQEARTRFKSQGDRLNEFQANEFLAMVDIERGDYRSALSRCRQLNDIGDKLQVGSEGPFARALTAFCHYAVSHYQRDPNADDNSAERRQTLASRLDELRLSDAKQRLAYILNRTALLELERDDPTRARTAAEEALRCAQALDRNSDKMLAHIALARVCRMLGDDNGYREHLDALSRLDNITAVKWARDRAAPLLHPEN